jgi:DNA-binding transcriptional LysR family regulator
MVGREPSGAFEWIEGSAGRGKAVERRRAACWILAGVSASADQIVSLIYFARVVEARSFTAAAGRLGVSKSVVSQRVSELEEQFRVSLLNRTTRKLSLTPEGLAVYQQCARLLVAAEDALDVVDAAGDAPSGTLRLEGPTAFAEDHLLAPIATYLARYDNMRVELVTRDRRSDLVAEGIDVALRISPELADSSLIARKLGTDSTVICASPDYLARKGEPRTPEDILQHDCILYSVLKVSHEWRLRSHDGEPISVPVTGRFAAESGSMLRRAALDGIGLCVMPRFMISTDLAAGRLRTVLDDAFAPIELGVYAIYPAARRPSAKVRAFVDLLVEHFSQPRW